MTAHRRLRAIIAAAVVAGVLAAAGLIAAGYTAAGEYTADAVFWASIITGAGLLLRSRRHRRAARR